MGFRISGGPFWQTAIGLRIRLIPLCWHNFAARDLHWSTGDWQTLLRHIFEDLMRYLLSAGTHTTELHSHADFLFDLIISLFESYDDEDNSYFILYIFSPLSSQMCMKTHARHPAGFFSIHAGNRRLARSEGPEKNTQWLARSTQCFTAALSCR